MDCLHRIAFRLAAFGFQIFAFAFRPRMRGVAVLVRRGDEILLIRNSYRRGFGVPGGLRRRNEPPLETAMRELREETGLSFAPEQLRFVTKLVVRHSSVEDHVRFFECVLEHPVDVQPDGREVVWAGFRSLEAAHSLPLWPPLDEFLRGQARGLW